MPASRRSAPVRFGSIGARPPPAFPGERIGLLGGSFNPPHAAHLLISQIATARLGLDRVWWIVSPGNPLKSHAELAPLADRMAAARSLVQGAGTRIVVTDFEACLPSAYTAATIAYLRRRSPAVRFVWLMGADNLCGFHRWQHWQDIAASMPIAVVDRPDWRLRATASRAARSLAAVRLPEHRARQLADLGPPKWTLLTGPLSPLSSTVLRARGEWPKSHA